jgi:uncharacterized spore protein YtfJ
MQPHELLESIAEKVRSLARTDTIVGAPIVLGDATLLPVTRVMVGFGGGSGSADAERAGDAPKGSGGGGGGGVRVEPAAFIVLQGGQVTVMAVPGKRGALSELFEQVPDLVEKISAAQAGKGTKEGA